MKEQQQACQEKHAFLFLHINNNSGNQIDKLLCLVCSFVLCELLSKNQL